MRTRSTGQPRASIAAGLIMVIVVGTLVLILARPHTTGTTIGVGSQSSSSTRTPASSAAAWLAVPSSLAGKTLHWRENTYSYTAGSPDPANGKIVTAEIWETLGTDGIPETFHGIYTLPDGTFHQEILQTRTSVTILRGNDYAQQHAGIPNCNTGASTTDAMRTFAPVFAKASSLMQLGYQQSAGTPTKTWPDTPALSQAVPVATFGRQDTPATTTTIWRQSNTKSSTTGNAGTIKDSNAVEVDAQGYVLVTQAQRIDASGNVLAETWFAFGPLDVYTPDTVPASVLALAHQSSGGCK